MADAVANGGNPMLSALCISILLFTCSVSAGDDKTSTKVTQKLATGSTANNSLAASDSNSKKLDQGKPKKVPITAKLEPDPKPAANNGSQEEDWQTAPAENILFPETYLSSIKRKLENSTMSSNTSQPITKNGLGKKVGDEEGEKNIKESKDKSSTEDSTKKVRLEGDHDASKKGNESSHQCSKAVDLVFLLDSSESVKYENWNQIIKFVKDLCDRFSTSLTRLAVIRYDSEAEIALPLTHFPDALSRDTAIENIYYKTGGTRTDIALEKCIELLHSVERRKASQVLILVTDGPSNKLEINRNNFVEGKDLVHAPAQLLKEEGVALFAIGVEPDSQTTKERSEMKEELQVIASDPVKSHMFIADGYRELERKVTAISKAACVVNGGWSIWSEYSPCSVTCGSGTKVRMRTCTNPIPENNGAECTGVRVETESCDMGPCSALTTQVGQILKLYSNGNFIAPIQGTSVAVTSTNQSGQQNVLEENHLNTKRSACPGGYEEIPVQDDQLSSSSSFGKEQANVEVEKQYAPLNSRLNNVASKGSWCAGEKNSNATEAASQFLQIDLRKSELIGMIATQGSHALEKWVKKYFLKYSEDGANWFYYRNKTTLDGNIDQDGVVKSTLNPPIKGRFFQINPQEWNEPNKNDSLPDICMRAALFRCGGKEVQQKRNQVPPQLPQVLDENVVMDKQNFKRRRSYINNSKGSKRILSKLRRMAKHIVKKMKKKAESVSSG